ncbi:amino acid efflux transporter [Paenibacillus barengoltzii J12]|uniref:Amino acid efflux transporter n=1 Tax=Paenibacillus barengoltzii J12 TaxID=935846 RepID=A0ABY1M0Q2_9BACL|nr:amino acid efflux transporter [Paenibacillus barengoltzii J12]
MFLMFCFIAVMLLYGTGTISLSTLIQFPNATFILTYMGGCAAGIRLLKGSRIGVVLSWISFAATAIVFPFTGWAMLYPLLIALLFLGIQLRFSRRKATSLDI